MNTAQKQNPIKVGLQLAAAYGKIQAARDTICSVKSDLDSLGFDDEALACQKFCGVLDEFVENLINQKK